jgi:predicted ABC-type ATPase
MKSKNVYIIAGPNGSGKTTFATEFLPNFAKCPNFVNADLIAQGLSPFFPKQMAIKAGKLVLQQIRELVGKGVDFGFETTLSGKTYLKHFRYLKSKGYKLHLFFLWISNTQLAIARIKDRVARGGHAVPSEDVKRRFKRSMNNFFKEYRLLADQWILFDNAQARPRIIAKKQNAHIDVTNHKLCERITREIGVTL